jgi:hypothetical protein
VWQGLIVACQHSSLPTTKRQRRCGTLRRFHFPQRWSSRCSPPSHRSRSSAIPSRGARTTARWDRWMLTLTCRTSRTACTCTRSPATTTRPSGRRCPLVHPNSASFFSRYTWIYLSKSCLASCNGVGSRNGQVIGRRRAGLCRHHRLPSCDESPRIQVFATHG